MKTSNQIKEFILQNPEIIDELKLIQHLPDYKRDPAENRFLMIKEYSALLKIESERLGKNFRKTLTLINFCNDNGLNHKTFYQYLKQYKEGGIKALVPKWGHRKGESIFSDYIFYIIQKIVRPEKGYMYNYKKLLLVCEKKKIQAPSYNTFRRIVIANGLINSFSKKKDKFGDDINHFNREAPEMFKNIISSKLIIDMNDPLGCLQQLKKIIEKTQATNPNAKEVSLFFLNHFLSITDKQICKYKPIFLNRPLMDEEIRQLKIFKSGVHKNHRIRAIAILMANKNKTMPEILLATGRSRATIYSYLKKFKEKGIDFIETRMDRKKNNDELRERTNRLVKILQQPPINFGINKSAWTLGDLAKVYKKEYGKELSRATIGRAVKATNYSWRRAKRALPSSDPEYREKTKKVLDTLQGLSPNDAFFFIDEAGPWQVKKYGGKSWTKKGEEKTFPQFQKPKGRVTFIGALDAEKNQVVWFFTKSKNTAVVACLIKILFFKYHNYSTLNLTWDCASWHKSKGLQQCLDELNNREVGPKINVVSLPKQSQNLNVIESIFSGVKNAVIFNSDYGSEYEMKMAIDRHFRERNAYYKANPKRAGNKIWDKEYYSLDHFESGLHRRM